MAHLGAFLEVPDQLLAVAEDAVLLPRLDAAFFQVAEARDGLLVKLYDPNAAPQDALRSGFRRNGLEIDRLEATGRFRWCPVSEPAGVVTSLRQLLNEEPSTGRSVWAGCDLPEGVDAAAVLRQQVALAELVAAHSLVVATGVIEPAAETWPPARQQWQLLGSLRGVVRYAQAGLMVSRVVLPPLD